MVGTLLSYIDPTGGLPPSMWGTVLAGALGAVAAAAAGLRWLAGDAAARVTPWRRAATLTVAGLLAGLALGAPSGPFPAQRRAPPDSGSEIAVKSVRPDSRSTGIPDATGPRVVVLAFDGLDPNLLEEYLADGRLPHFARLRDEGVCHSLATVQPPQSPVAWSSFITGAPPASHGVFDFIRRDPATYRLDLSLADRRRLALPWTGTPFWELPACRVLGVTALRLPMVFPPPKGRARILAGMGVWDVRGTEGTYIYLSTRPPERVDLRGLVSELRREGTSYSGEIPGPYRTGEADTVRVPFAMQVSGDVGTLKLQGRDVVLPVGRWSDWIEIEFRLGALGLTRVPAIARMLLKRTGDDVSLYISPPQLDPRAPLQPISEPRGYSAELAGRIGLFATRGMPFDTQAVSDGILSDDDFLGQAREITAETERMLHFELDRFGAGVLFAYFEASDVVQHLFWRCLDREHPLYAHPDSVRHRDVIPREYAECDRILGEVRARLGNTPVVVLSDHGFGAFRRSLHLNAVLRELECLALAEGRRASGELFADVDWTRTKAYAAGFNAVYVNRAGRERDGIVAADRTDALCAELSERLTAWTDPETGERPIATVTRVGLSAGDAHAPDLVIGYARGWRASWQTALGAVPEATAELNRTKWSGDHCVDCRLVPGVFLSSDRALDAASLQDVGRAIESFLAARSRNAK